MTTESGLGWAVYDWQFADATHVGAMARLRPSVVRWFVSIDRYVRTGAGSPAAFPWDFTFGQAWDVAASSGTKVIIQLQMKRSDWSGGDPGNLVGAALWKAGSRACWPADPDRTWVPFVRQLAAALEARNVNVVGWGAWNEPDWCTGWPWQFKNGSQNQPAPVTEWLSNQWLWWQVPPFPPMGWSGGFDRLHQLRTKLPLRWTSDGVGAISPDWLRLTAADPAVQIIDVHGYYDVRVGDLMGHIGTVVDAFDHARLERLPILVGEWGENAQGTAFTPGWQARDTLLRGELERNWPGRILGVCAHLQGTRQGVTYPALWEVL